MQEIIKTLLFVIIAAILFEIVWSLFVYDSFPQILDIIRGIAELAVIGIVIYITSIHVRDGLLILY